MFHRSECIQCNEINIILFRYGVVRGSHRENSEREIRQRGCFNTATDRKPSCTWRYMVHVRWIVVVWHKICVCSPHVTYPERVREWSRAVQVRIEINWWSTQVVIIDIISLKLIGLNQILNKLRFITYLWRKNN